MGIVRSTRLWFKGGTSDKVYEVDLVENEGIAGAQRFLVNIRYGRRGSRLREGTRTTSPVGREAAEKIFDSVIVAKVNEGYRRTDEAPAGGEPGEDGEGRGADGRARTLLARLAACVAGPWPDPARDRLLWRIGEVRIRAATPDLIALAGKLGPEASYSLVFALARAGGAEAAPTLREIARTATSHIVRGLAGFALVSPLMGEARERAEFDASYPESLTKARASRDPDRIVGALAELAANARNEGALDVGRAMIALARAAQGDEALRAALAAALLRLPARPPYLIGLRRIYKYAEMADDAALFGAAAHRFETATSMYKASAFRHAQVYVPELRRSVKPAEIHHLPDAPIGLGEVTLLYFKRRIWRTLRKRGELSDPTFADLAAALLLALRPADIGERSTWTHFVYGEGGRWSREPRASGPLARNWTASQILQRNDPQARPRPGSLTFVELPSVPAGKRPEAFPELWDVRPDLGLRLAAESPIWPVAMLGLRILQGNRGFMAELPAAALERLLASGHEEVQRLGFGEARDRLAGGAADDDLLAALLGAGLAEARNLAAERIEREGNRPWSGVRLAFTALTTGHEDLAPPVLRWARERRLSPDIAVPLAERVAEWLLTAAPIPLPDEQEPGEEDAPEEGSAGLVLSEELRRTIRLVRARMRHLWADRTMPLSREMVRRLMEHAQPDVAAAGIDILGLIGTDPATIGDEMWRDLLGSPAEEVREAALALFAGLSDEGLAHHGSLVVAFATSGSSRLRQAARPLVARIAARDSVLAERLARELIDTLFAAAPDESYPADIVALLREAMPRQLAALDPGTVWRLLQARAKGAQLLGAEILPERAPEVFSVRQIARLGNHAHLSVRRWVLAAYEANPPRFQAEAEEAVLLVESEWPEVQDFARRLFDGWPPETWTPATLAVITDSVKPDVLDFARHLLRSRLRPGDVEAQLTRLLEHPAQSMHLLVTEMLTQEAARSDQAFGKLLPLARIVLMQVLRGRVAKDRMTAFLTSEALRSRERARDIVPLFCELTLSGSERDRASAVLALRDISRVHEGLAEMSAVPLVRRSPPGRAAQRVVR